MLGGHECRGGYFDIPRRITAVKSERMRSDVNAIEHTGQVKLSEFCYVTMIFSFLRSNNVRARNSFLCFCNMTL